MREVPKDPTTKKDYEYKPEEGAGCPSYYWTFTVLEKEEDPQISELGCRIGCGPTEEEAEDYNYYITSPNAPDPFHASSGYWGCIGGACVEIGRNEENELECHPNYGELEDCEERCPAQPCNPV